MRRMNPMTLAAQQLDNPSRKTFLQMGLLSGLAALAPLRSARAANGRRIVCVGGALTEILYALQADADLVGVDTTSLYPESATKLPSVGYARTLSAEGVLALAPTQVIATEDAGPPAVLRQLTTAGITVSVLAANHRFEGLLDRVKRVGDITGRTTQASTMQQSLQQDWTKARAALSARSGKPTRVLFVLAHTPNQIMVGGAETSAQAMLEYAGAVNAVTGFSGYKPLTPEAVIAAQPDVILLTDQGMQASGGIDGILRLPGLEQTPAGRKRRVVSQEAMFMLGFGPRMPAALTALDGALTKAMRA